MDIFYIDIFIYFIHEKLFTGKNLNVPELPDKNFLYTILYNYI